WCGPCKMMDKTTWVDEKVVGWLKAHAVAIQIDVDALPDLSKQLRIGAMPTVIVFRGGEEFDRSVGLQQPGELIEWLDGVRAGKTTLTALEARAAADPEHVEKRFELAKHLLDLGSYDRATDQYVWLWENKHRNRRANGGTIGFFVARGSEQLIGQNEEARHAFVRVRDAIEARLNQGEPRADDRADWVTLNGVLGDDDRTLEWFDRVKNDPAMRPEIERCSTDIEALLTERERWADRGRIIGNVDTYVGMRIMTQRMVDSQTARVLDDDAADATAMMRTSFFDEMSRVYGSLLAADRAKEASRVVHAVHRYQSDGKFLVTAVEWAMKVGQPLPVHLEWLRAARQRGQEVDGLAERVRAALDDHAGRPPTPNPGGE
ncbi:MAG TPA: hypothetical protein DEB06_05180, partial [Phycisphaerales bacterium]|nr:hypothetical protein [Phycisphaerales bacterium]